MADRWVVLGGWGIAPEILEPVFGASSVYVDVNPLMDEIIDNKRLHPDWRQRSTSLLQPILQQSSPSLLAGWSTGALIALGCAPLLSVNALVCISATPSFCRTPEFTFGRHPRILRTMRKKLAADKQSVLDEFKQRCGIPDTLSYKTPWSAETCSNGLHALEQITLFDLPSLSCKPFLIHGTRDTIIALEGSDFLHRTLGGTFLPLDAPHACFLNNTNIIRSAIDTYLEGLNNDAVQNR